MCSGVVAEVGFVVNPDNADLPWNRYAGFVACLDGERRVFVAEGHDSAWLAQQLEPFPQGLQIAKDGNVSIAPLLKIDNVRAYLSDHLGEHFNIPENIRPGQYSLIDDLDDPVGQITTYVGNVCKSFITASLDLYIDALGEAVMATIIDGA